jgi:pyridinium-3,5-biscarboxylic acid mononucleotide synthase
MNHEELKRMTAELLAGELAQEEFLGGIAAAIEAAAQTTPAVTLDLDRQRRCGFPEVIFGEGKSAETIAAIFERLLASGVRALATRIAPEKAEHLLEYFVGRNPSARYNEIARTFRVDPLSVLPVETTGRVAIITAGTSDLPVAEEARETLEWMGIETAMIHDVGVAGPHRLPLRLPEFVDSDAIVCVAGMEAALPSIVGGYVPCPVIGVPTSVGYGANFGGVAALLSMLNSCAANVTVVNINAGFKGGYLAGLIASRSAKRD